jgi:hypothetical protein
VPIDHQRGRRNQVVLLRQIQINRDVVLDDGHVVSLGGDSLDKQARCRTPEAVLAVENFN